MTNTAVVTVRYDFTQCEVVLCPNRPVHPQTFIELLKRSFPLCLEHRNRHLAVNYRDYLTRLS